MSLNKIQIWNQYGTWIDKQHHLPYIRDPNIRKIYPSSICPIIQISDIVFVVLFLFSIIVPKENTSNVHILQWNVLMKSKIVYRYMKRCILWYHMIIQWLTSVAHNMSFFGRIWIVWIPYYDKITLWHCARTLVYKSFQQKATVSSKMK